MDSKNEIVRALLTKAKTLELDVMLDRSVRIKSDSIVADEGGAVQVLGMDALEPVTDEKIKGSMDFFYDLLSQTWYKATGGGAPNSSLQDCLTKLDIQPQLVPAPLPPASQQQEELKQSKNTITQAFKTFFESKPLPPNMVEARRIDISILEILNKQFEHANTAIENNTFSSKLFSSQLTKADQLFKNSQLSKAAKEDSPNIQMWEVYKRSCEKSLKQIRAVSTIVQLFITLQDQLRDTQSDLDKFENQHDMITTKALKELQTNHNNYMASFNKDFNTAVFSSQIAAKQPFLTLIETKLQTFNTEYMQRIEEFNKLVNDSPLKAALNTLNFKVSYINDIINNTLDPYYKAYSLPDEDLSKIKQSFVALQSEQVNARDITKVQKLYKDANQIIKDAILLQNAVHDDYMQPDQKTTYIMRLFGITADLMSDFVSGILFIMGTISKSEEHSAVLEQLNDLKVILLEIANAAINDTKNNHPNETEIIEIVVKDDSLRDKLLLLEPSQFRKYQEILQQHLANSKVSDKIYMLTIIRALMVIVFCESDAMTLASSSIQNYLPYYENLLYIAFDLPWSNMKAHEHIQQNKTRKHTFNGWPHLLGKQQSISAPPAAQPSTVVAANGTEPQPAAVEADAEPEPEGAPGEDAGAKAAAEPEPEAAPEPAAEPEPAADDAQVEAPLARTQQPTTSTQQPTTSTQQDIPSAADLAEEHRNKSSFHGEEGKGSGQGGGTGIHNILYNPFLQKFINNVNDSYTEISKDIPKLYHNTKNGVDELWAVLNGKYVVIVSNEPKTKPTINFGEFVSDNGKTKLKKHTMITKEVSEMIWV